MSLFSFKFLHNFFIVIIFFFFSNWCSKQLTLCADLPLNIFPGVCIVTKQLLLVYVTTAKHSFLGWWKKHHFDANHRVRRGEVLRCMPPDFFFQISSSEDLFFYCKLPPDANFLCTERHQEHATHITKWGTDGIIKRDVVWRHRPLIKSTVAVFWIDNCVLVTFTTLLVYGLMAFSWHGPESNWTMWLDAASRWSQLHDQ